MRKIESLCECENHGSFINSGLAHRRKKMALCLHGPLLLIMSVTFLLLHAKLVVLSKLFVNFGALRWLVSVH